MFRSVRRFVVLFGSFLLAPYGSADTAVVQDGGGVVYRSSRNSINEARAAGLAYCKRESQAGKCSLVAESKPKSYGYVAVAKSKTRTQAASGYDTADGANEAALQGCIVETARDDVCSIVLTFYDDTNGPLTSAAAGASHRKGPTDTVVQYSDNCYNGDCVRTFKGGKTMRFQAAYCHDPFSGKWDWKPDGC